MRTRGEFIKKNMNCSYQLHNLECKTEHNNQKKKLHCDFIAVNIRTYSATVFTALQHLKKAALRECCGMKLFFGIFLPAFVVWSSRETVMVSYMQLLSYLSLSQVRLLMSVC